VLRIHEAGRSPDAEEEEEEGRIAINNKIVATTAGNWQILCLAERSEGRCVFVFDLVLGGIISVGLLVYLVCCLIRAEVL
jgi:K+-transporting ATPase KdpF subunit